ncbi:Monooxygenase FAD-binding protein [Pseudohyphozyma bogoriensis]|nr:Monooxygenase FAD-binding protein [Pseudohyphozyma bogoriensis]
MPATPEAFHKLLVDLSINEAATSSPGASFFVATGQDAINKTAALIEFHNAFSACHGILLVGYHVSEMPESKIYALDIPKIDASKSVEASREV